MSNSKVDRNFCFKLSEISLVMELLDYLEDIRGCESNGSDCLKGKMPIRDDNKYCHVVINWWPKKGLLLFLVGSSDSDSCPSKQIVSDIDRLVGDYDLTFYKSYNNENISNFFERNKEELIGEAAVNVYAWGWKDCKDSCRLFVENEIKKGIESLIGLG